MNSSYQEYSEYVERIFPNDTAVTEDANDEDFDGRVLARPGEYPHMVRSLQLIINYHTPRENIKGYALK